MKVKSSQKHYQKVITDKEGNNQNENYRVHLSLPTRVYKLQFIKFNLKNQLSFFNHLMNQQSVSRTVYLSLNR